MAEDYKTAFERQQNTQRAQAENKNAVDREANPSKSTIDDLLKLATSCDIPPDALNEEIESIKEQEAQAINRSGIERQLQEIIKGYGPLQMQKFTEKIEGVILDHARRGKTVVCSECETTEFLLKATVRNKQQYICRSCVKAGK